MERVAIFAAGDVQALASALLDVSHPSRLSNYQERARQGLEDCAREVIP